MADDFLASTSTTGSVAIGGSAPGDIETAGDADWFAIGLFAGTTYRFDLEGSGTGRGTLFSPQLELRDSGGNLLLSDTNSGGISDEGTSSRLTYTATATGTFYLASDPAGSATGTYTVSATSLGSIPDDRAASTSTTGSVAIGSFATGNIETTGDADWFAVSLISGKTYQFDLGGSDAGQGTLDFPQLELRDGSGSLLLSDTTGGGVGESGWSSRITYLAGATATYYLASDPAGNAIGTYRITAIDTAASSNNPPSITSNGGGATASVLRPENTFTVTTVTASDTDPGTSLAFSISGGADSGQFQIDAETGALSFIAAPDFQNPTDVDHNNTYVVQVRASDGSLFDDQIITVNISDVRAVRNDFSGDAHSDILLQNANTGACYIWQQDGTSRVAEGPVGWTPGAAWQAKDTGDYNGDGKSDILLQNANTGDCYIWQLDGTSLVGHGAAGWTPGAAWQAKDGGDFNGDGKSDILLQNANTGDAYMWMMNGTALAGHGGVGSTPGSDWHIL